MSDFKLKIDAGKYSLTVTFYERALTTDGREISIEQLITESSTQQYHSSITKLRGISNEELRNRYMNKFPRFATQAVLRGHEGDKDIVQLTNLAMVTIDFLESDRAKEKFPVIADVLKRHSICQRYSITGTGIDNILLIADPKKSREYIDTINQRFRELGFDEEFKNVVQKALISSGDGQILNESPIPFDGTFEGTVAISIEKKSVKQRVSDSVKKEKKGNPFVASVNYLKPRYAVVRDSLSGNIFVNGVIINDSIVSTMVMDCLLHGLYANKDFITTWVNSSYVKVRHGQEIRFTSEDPALALYLLALRTMAVAA